MSSEQIQSSTSELTEELSRILEIGRLLSTVLTVEGIENLRGHFMNKESPGCLYVSFPLDLELGNTSVP